VAAGFTPADPARGLPPRIQRGVYPRGSSAGLPLPSDRDSCHISGVQPTPPKAVIWARRVALALGYLSLFAVVSTYRAQSHTVRSPRPKLGVIRIVPERSPGGIDGWVAHFEVDVSVEKAWSVLGRCEEWPRVLKGMASCEALEGGADHRMYQLRFRVPKHAHMKARMVLDPKRHRLEWRMVEGSFQAAEGFIRLAPRSDRRDWSRVTYGYFLKISPLLPKTFEVPRVGRSLRRMAFEIQEYFMGPTPTTSAAAPRDASGVPR
jgi:hypothetical protein